VSNSGQRLRAIALVCEPADAEVLKEFIPAGMLRGIEHYTEPGFLNWPVICLAPNDLRRPEDPGSASYRRWVQVIHLISRRTFIQLSRVTEKRGLADSGTWWEYYRGQVNPETQESVRGAREALVVIFERSPTPDELASLTSQFASSVLYLMMPQLRVTQDEQRLAFSMYVWHHAVIRLLTRLASFDLPPPGIYAWRGLEIRDADSHETQLKAAEELDKFVKWIYVIETQPREVRQILLPESLIPRPTGNRKARGGVLQAFGSAKSWIKARAKGETLPAETDTPGDSQPSSEPENAEGIIPAPDTRTEEKGLRKFPSLPLDGSGTAPDLVNHIIDPKKVEQEARKAGDSWRQRETNTPQKLEQEARGQTSLWGDAAEHVPPRGGPGKPNEIFLTALYRIVTAGEGEAVKRMVSRWATEFGRDETDYERERHLLSQLAAELQRARGNLLALWARVGLGLLCAGIVGFVVAQAVETWSGIWRGGKVFGVLPVREGHIILWFAISATLGIVAGIVVPYFLEVSRGKKAAKALAAMAVRLKQRMVDTLNRRLQLCRNSRELARSISELSIQKLTRLLANRAGNLIKEALDNRPGLPDKPPASALTARMQRPHEVADDAAFSRDAYLSLSLLEVSASSHLTAQRVSRANDTGAATKDEIARWCKALNLWKGQMPRVDFKSSGWFPREIVPSLLERVCRSVIAELKIAMQPDLASDHGSSGLDAQTEGSIINHLDKWHPPTGRLRDNLGMLSVHCNVWGGDEQPQIATFILSDTPVYADFLKQNLGTRTGISKPVRLPENVAELPFLFSAELLAQVFQELHIQFRPDYVGKKEFSWFSLASSQAATGAGVVAVHAPE
jgi:hypothetical protein